MSTQPMPCSVREIGSLFLFKELSPRQLRRLCDEGRVETFQPGPVYAEGDPATCFFVMIEGTVVASRRVGEDDVEINRTSQPGVYGGAMQAYLGDRVPQVYSNSLRVTEPTRLFVLSAKTFAGVMHEWFPMAVHLLEGLFFGAKNTHEAIGQRERLLALGSLSAGLTHELNNPAAAAVRAAAALRERVATMWRQLAEMPVEHLPHGGLSGLAELQRSTAARVRKGLALSPAEAADREDSVSDWLEGHAVAQGWQLAPIVVQAGLDTEWLDGIASGVDTRALQSIVEWLCCTVELEMLTDEIVDSTERISGLVSAAKQYSQLDRAPHRTVNVHELLDSTLTLLSDRFGSKIEVVRDYDLELPDIPAYPAELNQVWTNLIDNAVSAMEESGGAGTLTVRTSLDPGHLLVEFQDTGTGIPPDIQQRIFDPFFTTKPVGKGTGLGLDISWRIVVNKHHGSLRVRSKPGETCFKVLLPLTAP
ncbi:ATP-binding protein [Streptomyces sp. NPDC002740]